MPAYPTLSTARLTSVFGWRTHPITGLRTWHDGIDLAPAVSNTPGVPIYAVQNGVVVKRAYHSAMGYYLMVKHSQEIYTTLYQHLASFNVELSDFVTIGQQIAVMGTSGSSTGIHLHFGVSNAYPMVWGAGGTFIDPVPYLRDGVPPDPLDPPPVWEEYEPFDTGSTKRIVLRRR